MGAASLQANLDLPFGKAGEAFRVGARRLCPAHHALVASHLTLAAQAAFDPHQRRVQWEQNQGQLLEKIGPIVAAAQVFGLVQNHLLKFARRQAREEPFRNQNARREKANHAGAVEPARRAKFGDFT